MSHATKQLHSTFLPQNAIFDLAHDQRDNVNFMRGLSANFLAFKKLTRNVKIDLSQFLQFPNCLHILMKYQKLLQLTLFIFFLRFTEIVRPQSSSKFFFPRSKVFITLNKAYKMRVVITFKAPLMLQFLLNVLFFLLLQSYYNNMYVFAKFE